MLGSSSSGNCYIFDNGKEALILEAGVRFADVKKALGYNLRKVVGCLITHRHNDHAKYIKEVVESGVWTLALQEVWDSKGVWGSRSIALEYNRGYRFGGFKVFPFSAIHDVECVGYVIDHPDSGKVMFLTDSCDCDYRFNGLSHIMIECNYSHTSLVKAIQAGRTLPSQRERLLHSHLELSGCKEILATTDLSRVENIVLVHLSENNANESLFVSEIERATGKVVYAAKKGLTIDITKL